MIADKLKGLLAMSGRSQREVAEKLGISHQAVNTKFRKNSFSINDIIQICDLCEANITMSTQDGQTISLDLTDL